MQNGHGKKAEEAKTRHHRLIRSDGHRADMKQQNTSGIQRAVRLKKHKTQLGQMPNLSRKAMKDGRRSGMKKASG